MGVHAGALAATSVALPVLVVSVPVPGVVPLMNRCPVVLLNVALPEADALTSTLISHVLFGAIVPFENEIEPLPALGANVGEPQPTKVAFVGVATTKFGVPVGKLSVKLTPLIVTVVVFGMVSFKVAVVTPSARIELGTKLLVIFRSDAPIIVAMRVEVEKSEL